MKNYTHRVRPLLVAFVLSLLAMLLRPGICEARSRLQRSPDEPAPTVGQTAVTFTLGLDPIPGLTSRSRVVAESTALIPTSSGAAAPPLVSSTTHGMDPIRELTSRSRVVAETSTLITTSNGVPPEALVGTAIPLPVGALLTLRISAKGDFAVPVSYTWSGTNESDDYNASSATFSSADAGLYSVSVRTIINGLAGPELTVSIQVIDVTISQITLTLGDPAGFVTYVGNPFMRHATVSPSAFGALVEWYAPSHSPELGYGEGFTTSRSVIGNNYPITARLAGQTTRTAVMVYSAQWVSKPTFGDWLRMPVSRFHYEIRTDPPGYESQVHWVNNPLGTAETLPTTGTGATFDMIRINHPDALICWLVTVANLVDYGDHGPVNPPTSHEGRACQRPKQPDCPDTDCPCSSGGPPATATNSVPVTLSNGEATLRAEDLRVASRGFDFVWGRTYSSRADFSDVLGANWEPTFNRRVYVVSVVSGTVSIIDGAGREDTYLSAGGNNYVSPPGLYDTLVKNLDNTWTQTMEDGSVYRYDTSGYMVSEADRHGNTESYVRNANHNVIQVTDTQGRIYTLAYTDASAFQKVQSITDFAGRTVRYAYDGNGDLRSVRTPTVTGTPNGNDFPAGKTTLYAYASGNGDVRLNHNLLSVIEPGYNVGNDPAQSKAIATLTYAATTDPTAVDFDHVTAELWGHPSGGPSFQPSVGGSASYLYAANLSGDSDAPAGAVLRATYTDRNQNVHVHYFDATAHETKTIARTNRNVRPGEIDYVTSYAYSPEGLLLNKILPRGNEYAYLYDSANPLRSLQRNLLEERRKANGVGGGGVDLVTRYTYEPVYRELRTMTDPRAFPAGNVPLTEDGHLDLGNASVARYTTTTLFDYQEATGFQAAKGIALSERIPEGFGDLNAAPDFNQGNSVKVQYPTIQTAGPNFGQQASALMTWNASGQNLTHVDPEGHVTKKVYYSGEAGGTAGNLKQEIRDFGGFNLTATMAYDSRDNVNAITDPKGETTNLTVNEFNQVVRSLSRPVAGAIRYQTDSFYDANNNLVRTERQNLDESGLAYAHNPIVDTYVFDILHLLVEQDLDKTRNDGTSAGTAITRFYTDPNENQIAVQLPESVNGHEPSNIVTTQFDERNKPYKITTGDNDTNPDNATPATASVQTLNYCICGSVLETIDTIRNAQSPSAPTTTFPTSAAGDVTRRNYDGFDRLISVIDAEGNLRGIQYDLASRIVRETLTGPVDHTGSPVRLLMQADTTFDELGRVVQTDTRHFDTVTGADIGDGHSVATTKYDRDNKTIEITDDRGKRTTTQWDTADRRHNIIDALNNETEWSYDANSNVLILTRRDISTELGTPPQSFITTMAYDGVDRLMRTVSPTGDVHEVLYDSRGNVVKTSDAVRGSGQPNGPGNIVVFDYDALGRQFRAERKLTANGRGDGAPAGCIVTTQAFDDDARLVSRTDANSHAETYLYDALGRVTSITAADGTVRRTQFDADNHVVEWTDPNGTDCLQTYDGLDRLLSRVVRTPGTGVIGSTSEVFGYDGASRATLLRNGDGFHPGTHDVLVQYDSLSNRTRDDQAGLAVNSVYDGIGNQIESTYPGAFGGGSRTLTKTYDDLERLASLADTSPIASWHYKGPSRLERRIYGPDGSLSSKLDLAYDGFPRLIEMNHATAGGANIAGFHYGYDREGNRLYEKRTRESNTDEVYAQDSIYRLDGTLQGVDLTGVASGQEILPEDFASSNSLAWAYDGVGNRTTSTKRVAGVPTVTTYTEDSNDPPADAQVNQYTTTQEDSNPVVNYVYDLNGNMTSDGQKKYAYDFKNRMVEVRDWFTNNLVVRYSYDAADRRHSKEATPALTATRYVYARNQVVEERDADSVLKRQYVWGDGLDELLQLNTAASAAYFSHDNVVGSIEALTNASGIVVERYSYDPFGNRTIILNAGIGLEYGFQGARHDPETPGLVSMRARMYSAMLGRFIQRDPTGVWTDDLGNGFSFVANGPVNGRDPSGRDITSEQRARYDKAMDLARNGTTVAIRAQAYVELEGVASQILNAQSWYEYIDASKAREMYAAAAAVGVPHLSAVQLQAAQQAEQASGKALSGQSTTLEYTYYGLKTLQVAGTAASVALGGVGVLGTAAKAGVTAALGQIGENYVVGLAIQGGADAVAQTAVALGADPDTVETTESLGLAAFDIWNLSLYFRATKARWPDSADEMNRFLGVQGKSVPDGPTTAGRYKTVWNLGKCKIRFEQHPYHPNTPKSHRGPHWHLETPCNPKQKFLPGDLIPGL